MELASGDGSGGGDIEWNFVKWLVGRNGLPVKRYPSAWDGAALERDVLEQLAALPHTQTSHHR